MLDQIVPSFSNTASMKWSRSDSNLTKPWPLACNAAFLKPPRSETISALACSVCSGVPYNGIVRSSVSISTKPASVNSLGNFSRYAFRCAWGFQSMRLDLKTCHKLAYHANRKFRSSVPNHRKQVRDTSLARLLAIRHELGRRWADADERYRIDWTRKLGVW